MKRKIALIGFLLVIAFSSAGVWSAQAEPSMGDVPFTGCANPADQSDMPEAECLALLALLNSTNGGSWTVTTGWKFTDTPCTWYRVTCTSGHVTSLTLYNNNLVGTIPAELGNLSNLEILRLDDNSLSGSIPPQLGNLSNLELLNLRWNSLSGSIPPELGNLSNLEQLNLTYNSLSGSIPPELGNLSSIREFYLSNNSLSGSIPPELGNLTSMRWFDLHNNSLSGSIPSDLGNLSNLRSLYITGNSLSGKIPKQLGKLSNLRQLRLNNNSLTGSIPPQLGSPSKLEELDLSSNSLTGIIPAQLGKLSNLERLDFDGNTNLNGWLPSSLTNLTSLNHFYFDNTSLCERPDTPFQDWLDAVHLAGVVIGTNNICSLIFTDGFESGSFSAWNVANTGSGDLKVCTKAALNGTYGMCVKNKTNKKKFVTDSGMSETWLSAQFNFDPNGLKLQNKKKVRILQAKDGSTATHWLEFRKKSGKFQVRALAKLDGSGKVKTGWQKIANKPHLIEVEWMAATGAGNNDGYLKLYVDDQLKKAKSGLDNDTFVIDILMLGFTNSPKKFSVSGVFFIDDFVSSDTGYIGQ